MGGPGCIVDAHHARPFAWQWGDGSTSSSDGQAFRAGRVRGGASEVNANYPALRLVGSPKQVGEVIHALQDD